MVVNGFINGSLDSGAGCGMGDCDIGVVREKGEEGSMIDDERGIVVFCSGLFFFFM